MAGPVKYTSVQKGFYTGNYASNFTLKYVDAALCHHIGTDRN